MGRRDDIFVKSQYLVPQGSLSRLAGKIAASTDPRLKNAFIKWFVKKYQVDMSEAAESEPEAFASFNDFFTRALKPGARTIDSAKDALVSPVDGAVSQLGTLLAGRILQAKGRTYSALELFGGDSLAARPFHGGEFATIYLAPKDYHRIHMPCDARLTSMIHVPGRLFSVNPATAEAVPSLFARNERVICVFDTEFGPFAMVLVGAMIVASIATTWAGLVGSGDQKRTGATITRIDYEPDGDNPAPTFLKGEEMGRFHLGSTVILLAPPDSFKWNDALHAGSRLRLGERIATLNPKRG
ncbi:MAG: phosphatidylserine decarboxylase [unclassified Hahellaceae]|nr:phosphatidylserine decarboxylase [Hahellaceae bacterium]|tara:strand:+ start:5731 stop:6624 length:894 start_codon:yes stop_codon:yes gene_type:complete